MRHSFLLVALSLLCGGIAAHADTTYYYTGHDYTSVSGIATTSESITGELTLSSPLGDSLHNAAVTPVSFSFNDGPVTITNAGGSFDYVHFSTDASGDITGWYIFFENNPYYDLIDISKVIEGNGDQAAGRNYTASNSVAGSFSTTPPEIAATPEPSSLILLGTGALGLAGAARRRFLKV